MQLTEQDTFKKSSAPYALDRGAPKFDLVEVKSKKDQHYNLAIQQAQREFDNLKQIAEVINKQALDIKDQLALTNLVYKAEYQFQPVAGNNYWLVRETKSDALILCILGPKDWSAGAPKNYQYLEHITFLPNGLWKKVLPSSE